MNQLRIVKTNEDGRHLYWVNGRCAEPSCNFKTAELKRGTEAELKDAPVWCVQHRQEVVESWD